MGINNLEQISECFEDKQMVRDVINTFLEEGLDDIRSLITALKHHNLTDQEKKELAIFYINNRTKDGIMNNKLRALICDHTINSKFSYPELKKLLCYYVYDNSTYDLIAGKGKPATIMDRVEERIIDGLVQNEGWHHVEKRPENKSAYRGLLYIITTNPNIFKYRAKNEIDSLIYTGLEDKGRVLRSIVTDENLLRYRTVAEQRSLMRRYMQKPYGDVAHLITDEVILSKLSAEKQMKLLDEYNERPGEETLKNIRAKLEMDDKPISVEDFTGGTSDGR